MHVASLTPSTAQACNKLCFGVLCCDALHVCHVLCHAPIATARAPGSSTTFNVPWDDLQGHSQVEYAAQSHQSTAQHNKAQYSPVQHSTAQCSTAQPSTAQRSAAQQSRAGLGQTWLRRPEAAMAAAAWLAFMVWRCLSCRMRRVPWDRLDPPPRICSL